MSSPYTASRHNLRDVYLSIGNDSYLIHSIVIETPAGFAFAVTGSGHIIWASPINITQPWCTVDTEENNSSLGNGGIHQYIYVTIEMKAVFDRL